jgi:hypothetical protein
VCSFGGSLQQPSRATIATSYQSRGAPRERPTGLRSKSCSRGCFTNDRRRNGLRKLFQDSYTELNQFNPANEKTSRSHEVSDAACQIGDQQQLRGEGFAWVSVSRLKG